MDPIMIKSEHVNALLKKFKVELYTNNEHRYINNTA